MKIYQSRYNKLPGSTYQEISQNAHRVYHEIKQRTRRNPYVRSAYFKKNKIFLDLFWSHLDQKTRRDRISRLKYYKCGIDLLRKSYLIPESRPNPNGKNEIVHRFAGQAKDGGLFFVQVKEDRRGNKYLMSIFPG
ncbi:hypothetical protein FWF48_03240 [Candidatus Saccharibacteria bacterium]|nr:hypothetical protein [Candidatus Saccharibacteria bacterium]